MTVHGKPVHIVVLLLGLHEYRWGLNFLFDSQFLSRVIETSDNRAPVSATRYRYFQLYYTNQNATNRNKTPQRAERKPKGAKTAERGPRDL